MLDLIDDRLINDVVSRAEQSRISYNLQTEEFRSLNANLQTYLNEIKVIDDENRDLQDDIRQIRSNYILTLENILTRLPNDFSQKSRELTEENIKRYKEKSRTRRFINEREELKRRIQFVSNDGKEQIKCLNILQKKERSVYNEFIKLKEQLQNCLNSIENEKQTHQQSMKKVDNLQIQLEQVCVERSKTEFEIQTLKEQVTLMQTAKDFLDEERETLRATETEANEYLLSRLNESIARIREDFDQLNKSQLVQIESEYEQMLHSLEENLTMNKTIDEATLLDQQTDTKEYERLQNEYESTLQEFKTLNNQNQILSEQVLSMETDLYALRDDRMKQLIAKDHQIEYNKIELKTLKDKLNNLAEYDRNLKFELTLYRGVLESEHRRKTQPKQSPINTSNLKKPTTSRSSSTSMTDQPTSSTSSNTSQSLLNDQQEEIRTSRNRVQSEYDSLGEYATVQYSSCSNSLITDDPLDAPIEVQQVASNLHSISSETDSAAVLIERASQSAASPIQQLFATPSEFRILPTIPSTNQTQASIDTAPITIEIRPFHSLSPDPSMLSEIQQASPSISSINSRSFFAFQRSPTSSTSSLNREDDAEPQTTFQLSSKLPESNIEQVPSSSAGLTTTEYQSSSDESSEVQVHVQPLPNSITIPTAEYQHSESDEFDESISKAPVASELIAENEQNTDNQSTIIQPEELPLSSIEQAEEFEVLLETIVNESEPLSFKLEEKESDSANKSNTEEREEEINSSLENQTQENNISSTIITDDENKHVPRPDTWKSPSYQTPLTDIEEVDLPTSPIVETPSDEDEDDPNLGIIMQDLRYVFNELADNEGLVEINNDLPDKLLDRLEFREHLIRTVFDGLLRKYLVEAAIQAKRPETLDWAEFRDILFPIITGRYTERHIRKLFDLFDITKDGYLSVQEIAELLQILQGTSTIGLAQTIVDEYDADHDGKLNADELMEALKKTENISENVLSQDTETKQWFNPSPLENQTISFEVPIIHFTAQDTYAKLNKQVSVLGNIFKNVGADSEHKQLDSHNEDLSTKITNEFIKNNVNISKDDLQSFIELFINKKQHTGFERNLDFLIDWIEFRETFLPILNDGYYSKDNIQKWFDIFDTNHIATITREQTLHLLRLLQIQNCQHIIHKLNEITDNATSWTFDELTFALINVDETCARMRTDNEYIEQIATFDNDWLSNNVF